jgi:hypothetical protein
VVSLLLTCVQCGDTRTVNVGLARTTQTRERARYTCALCVICVRSTQGELALSAVDGSGAAASAHGDGERFDDDDRADDDDDDDDEPNYDEMSPRLGFLVGVHRRAAVAARAARSHFGEESAQVRDVARVCCVLCCVVLCAPGDVHVIGDAIERR